MLSLPLWVALVTVKIKKNPTLVYGNKSADMECHADMTKAIVI